MRSLIDAVPRAEVFAENMLARVARADLSSPILCH
jgi:hypothetical protein